MSGGGSALSISTSWSCEEEIWAWSLSSVTFAKFGPYSFVMRARTWASVNLVTHISRGMSEKVGAGIKGERREDTVQPRLSHWRGRDGEIGRAERRSCHKTDVGKIMVDCAQVWVF